MNTKPIDQTKILTQSEIAQVIQDLKRRGKRSINSRANLVIFRLATCCGLRVSEICGLKMANVITGSQRPHIVVPKEIGKMGKARQIPLWWDAATLADLDAWKQQRTSQGAKAGSPFVASQSVGTLGKPLEVRNAQYRFKVGIRCLGSERIKMLSIHKGRHSFCSHSLHGGKTIAQVRDAAGHSNISVTNIYLHSVDDGGEMGSIFDFGK